MYKSEYKMTRTKNKLVEYWGRLDIVSTIDEDDDTIYWIDIIYHNTDVGIGYFKGAKDDFPKMLNEAEAFCMGYDKAIKDMEK